MCGPSGTGSCTRSPASSAPVARPQGSRGSGSGAGAAGWLFVAGMVLFSGSLYLLALGGPRWLGAVAPVGGLSFLVGWALLAWAAFRG